MKTTIITPSYAPDFERCRLLCQSVSRHVSGYEQHLIIVDKKDYALFSELESDKVKLIIKEDILPDWLYKVPFSKKWWFSTKTLPVRGWILQQIVKLSAHEYSDADNFLFIDSDVCFIRSFDVKEMFIDDQSLLSSLPRKEEDYQDKRKQSWHEFAAKLFGIEDTSILKKDYISQLVMWRRSELLSLTQSIENSALNNKNKSWKELLCNTLDFSEYTLYGIFVEHVLKEKSQHHLIDQEICYCSWHKTINSMDDLSNFINHIPKQYPAVLIQSNLGLSTKSYQHLLNGQTI